MKVGNRPKRNGIVFCYNNKLGVETSPTPKSFENIDKLNTKDRRDLSGPHPHFIGDPRNISVTQRTIGIGLEFVFLQITRSY